MRPLRSDPLSRVLTRAKLRTLAGHGVDAVIVGMGVWACGWIMGWILRYGLGVAIHPVWAIMIGGIVTMGWLVLHLPRIRTIHVAIALDQANQTHDLLASAWSMRTSDLPFAGIIVQLAQARIAEKLILPSPFGRVGVRISVATVLGSIAILLASSLIQSRIAPPVGKTYPITSANADNSPNPLVASIRPTRAANSDVPETTSGEDDPSVSTGKPTPAAKNPSDSASVNGNQQGRSNDGTMSQVDLTNAFDPAHQLSARLNGQGDGSSTSTPGTGTGGGATGSDVNSAPIAPWQGRDWASDRASALDRAQNADYSRRQRDLIRAYFQR